MRHTLLLGRVGLDINNVADAVRDQVSREFNGAVVYRSTSIDPSLDAAL